MTLSRLTLLAATLAACASPDQPNDTLGDEAAVSSPRAAGTIYITGRIIAGNKYHTAIEYCATANTGHWLSGGNSAGNLEGSVDLASDAPNNTVERGKVTPPPGQTAGDYFATLRGYGNKYCDCAPYRAVPTQTDGYNSNSYVASLIRHTGGKESAELGSYVGGNKILPRSFSMSRLQPVR